MKEKNLEELIDGFLLNKLNNADQARLRDIVTSDPEAATLLKESQETHRYILHLRYKKIRSQLRMYDEQAEIYQKNNWKKQLLSVAAFLLLTISGCYLVAAYSFSPRLVAKRNFEAIPIASLSSDVSGYVIAAEDIFKQDNFQSAGRLYQTILVMIDTSYVQQTKWNFLICQLASEGPTELWKKDMLIFISGTDDDFKMKAHRILRLFNSPFYRLTVKISTRSFSPIKPRLI